MSETFARMAPRYDALRPLNAGDRQRLQAMLETLLDARSPHGTVLAPADLVVDVGCGTGRLTLPLGALTSAHIAGIDSEPRMLEVARSKDPDHRIDWLLGTAYRLPIGDEQATLVLMAMVAHLLKQRTRAFREAHRILKPGGQLSIWTFTQRDIREFYLNPYFPSIPTIDLARFPAEATLMRELSRAGFRTLHTAIMREEGAVAIAQVVDRVRGRYISTLSLLPPLEYRLGLQRLEEELAQDPARILQQRLEWALLTAQK